MASASRNGPPTTTGEPSPLEPVTTGMISTADCARLGSAVATVTAGAAYPGSVLTRIHSRRGALVLLAVTDTSDLLLGPLDAQHRELGATFASFGGWLMPVSYAGTVGEHTATREAVGLFDVSHLGKASVRGPGAADYVNSALTNDLGRIGPGKAQYTLCCTESGGVIDDLIVYYVSDDEIFLVPNAANTAAV